MTKARRFVRSQSIIIHFRYKNTYVIMIMKWKRHVCHILGKLESKKKTLFKDIGAFQRRREEKL